MLRPFALLVALAAVLALQPFAGAGSSSSPEMPGNCNELANTGGGTTLGAPEARLCAAWFSQPDASTIAVSWQVVNLAHRFMPNESMTFWVGCVSGTTSVVVDVTLGWPWPQGDGDAFTPGTDPDPHTHYPVVTSGNVVTGLVPRSFWPAPECRTPVAGTLIAFKSPTCACWSSTSPIYWGQRAPDAGAGRSYFF
ncbi:MAG: hypothetical protein QOE90_2847 [Thermoplasmata archaeon]|jgi:hypothetical protein|nr:hypothetical protein [Thermoplasmata archaeon]